MKRTLSILFFSAVMFVAIAQTQEIKEASIQFELPSSVWKFNGTENNNKTTAHYYKRAPIIDSMNREVFASFAFVTEPVGRKMDLVSYSLAKRMAVPFDVIEVFTFNDKPDLLNYKYAIGYKGTYTDKIGISHTVYIVHLINNKTGVQLICDITTELLPRCENDFRTVISSLK